MERVDVDESASRAMTSGSMREWLRPTLGAVLFLAGAGGIAYKVISDYRHAAPDAFISVRDQNKVPAPSAAASAAEPSSVSADVTMPPRSAALEPDPSADAQNDSCVAIKAEQQEIEAALNKKYSAEEGRYLKRRLRELTEQSGKNTCGE